MKTLCIYHGACDDGFGAAYAVWKKLRYTVEYYPATHGDAPPDVTDRDVIIVDFSYKQPVLLELIQKCKSMILLDHHKSAEAELHGLEDPKLSMVFDMQRSGATIAWDYFHPNEPRPPLIQYVEDRDLWLKRLPFSDAVTTALRTYPQEFGVWSALDTHALATEGTAMFRYYRSQIEAMKPKAELMEIAGYKVPVINAPHFMSSDLAGELSEGYPFAATYSVDSRGIHYSLRSRKNGIDVSRVATLYDGGGHAHAAGFTWLAPVHQTV